MGKIYDFKLKTRKGTDKPMSDFKGTDPAKIEEHIKELL